MPSIQKSDDALPSRIDLSKYPRLTDEQAGHLRHFHNVCAAPDGEWPHMGALESMQEFADAYRYQLATMVYAASLAHYHHLPAARSLFKPLIHRLIKKMLRKEVWGYWYLSSQSGIRLDPDLKKLREPWADPIVRENIMYSGHLLMMTSLYAMLFDDDEFEQPGSLTFTWDPVFWGMGPEVYKYDNRSIQKAILTEMERNNWAGVCCEPNMIFVVCNQFPIIAMRYNDVRDGTHVVDELLEKYDAAVLKRGMISTERYFVDARVLKQEANVYASEVAFTAWGCAFMNTWKPDYVRQAYPAHAAGTITNIDGRIRIQPPVIMQEMKQIAAAQNLPINSSANHKKAIENYKTSKPAPEFPFSKPIFGYVAQWLSELGKTAELEGILEYADERLRPSWENGGLYYPRNDEAMDENCEWAYMDPFSGNAGIGYARLNVEDGQRKMYQQPWTREDLASRPYIAGLDFSAGFNCLRGIWDEETGAMVVTLKPWNGQKSNVAKFSIENLSAGSWDVYQNGILRDTYALDNDGSSVEVEISLSVREETDIVICKVF